MVPDLDAAAEAWVQLGVGPFLTIRDAEFERVEHRGEPAIFDHSAAFARETGALSHLGYDVEPHRAVRELDAFWEKQSGAAATWDGEEPLRPFY